MKIEEKILDAVINTVELFYKAKIEKSRILIQKTRKDFEGDFTVVVFSLLAYSKKAPDITAEEIGKRLKNNLPEISDYNVIKGFLNLTVSKKYWLSFFNNIYRNRTYGLKMRDENSKKKVIEFSSPNTNKPLHLGHIRNNLLGWSVSEILKANGSKVIKVNLVNDRGIHICKSMVAWKELSGGETPGTSGMKGDKLVGKYYVLFEKEYKRQIADLIKTGLTEAEAKKQAPWIKKAQAMLKRWERGNTRIINLWKKMNDWVYAGFDVTYNNLGISFDKIYYESDTYKQGKDIVMIALRTGELNQKSDGAVYLDLAEYDMDEKILLRADGTTVYMTQDIGTAVARYEDFNFDESIYVVGNEQDYHFKVLRIILDRLEYPWSNRISHLSYGMVELPEGKMKSREGTIVDADDLINEMIKTARNTSAKLGKLDGYSKEEKEIIFKKIALGALKFFILKVDAKKNMVFNPKESIDFNGHTGPFVQYSYVRINSLLDKADKSGVQISGNSDIITLIEKEKNLIKMLHDFPNVIEEAGKKRNPAIIANFVYDIAKEYNQFYHDYPILKESDFDVKTFRLALSRKTGEIIKTGLMLLGIEAPERM